MRIGLGGITGTGILSVGLGVSVGGGAGGGVSYLLRDLFATDRAAGAVDGTAAEPGPGTRDVTDTEGTNVLIADGVAKITGTNGWDASLLQYTTPVVREPGVVMRLDFELLHNSNLIAFGLKTGSGDTFGGYNNTGFYRLNSGNWFVARRTTTANSPNLWLTPTGASYTAFAVLRNSGKYTFIKSAGIIRFLWMDEWSTTSPLYVGINVFSPQTSHWDNISIPDGRYYSVVPLASDSFNRDDGAIGSTDGAGHIEANGGNGLAWTNQIGAYTVASDAAISSTLSGGIAIATVDTGDNHVFVRVKTTRNGGNVGVVLRYVDSDNYIIAYHDGTNAKLDKIVGGSTTNVISAAVDYVAGAYLTAVADGTAVWLYYNELYIGNGTVSDAVLQDSTLHGLYSTDDANTFDDFVAFARRGYTDLEDY